MNRKMHQVSVTNQNDTIVISQEGYHADESVSIWLSTDQIDALCKWLLEAKQEVESFYPSPADEAGTRLAK